MNTWGNTIEVYSVLNSEDLLQLDVPYVRMTALTLETTMAAACSKLSRGSWLYQIILYQVILGGPTAGDHSKAGYSEGSHRRSSSRMLFRVRLYSRIYVEHYDTGDLVTVLLQVRSLQRF